MAQKRINLWSSPRNVSTAFMYSWAQRKDTTVVDEPFYGYYLNEFEVNHIGKDEVIANMELNAQKIIDDVILSDYKTDIVFFKQMTHHIENLDWDFMNQCENIIFIRDPRLIIRSYQKVMELTNIDAVGIKLQCKLHEFLTNAIVLDSKDLLLNSKRTLAHLCTLLNIPFDEKMLQWQAGARKEDGIWAKYWYKNVHQSTGFSPYNYEEFELPINLEKLAEECLPYYEQLQKHALKLDEIKI